VTGLVAVFGGVAAVFSAAVFARAFPDNPSTLLWLVPWLVGYAGGLAAFRARPELVATRRLVLFGATSTAWIGVTIGVITGFEEVGRQWWLAPGNLAVQVLGLSMWAAMISLLAIYPDGAYRRRQLLLVARTVSFLAVAIPLGLLVVQQKLHPAWMFAWEGDSPTATRFPDIASPVHLPFLSFLALPMGIYLNAALATSPVVAAVVGWLRYRSLPTEGRLAMRWPMYGVVALLVAPLSGVLQAYGALSPSVAHLLQIAGLSALPASIAVGLVRPNLFDVDRVMKRSALYAALWTAIAVAYVGGAAAFGLAAPGEGVQLAIAATAGATLLFEPGRRYLARRAARWAYGDTVTGEEMVRRLGGALEHTHDLEHLIAVVATVAKEGMGVRWVRVQVDGVPAAVAGEPVSMREPAVASSLLLHGKEQVGEIACGPLVRGRIGRRSSEVDTELLATLARQAALAVQNARLATELRARLDEIRETTAELAASRSRIVAVHETARRQIERDIHDGAQQELVALIAGLGLARHQSAEDPGSIDETLAGLQVEVGQALNNLRELAGGIHPSVLSDHGLVEAIEIRSSRMPIDVTVDCDEEQRRSRFSDEVEGAAYFFVSEALTNTLKHADADRACVRVARDGELLEVAVSDNGIGFDVRSASRTGLRGLADRIEAIGGTIDVWSAPKRGTRLTMRLPL
jgi:signal transduction histidine kinase